MTQPQEWLEVESLDLEAQGVAHDADGKVVFIEGALPGEQVQVQVQRRKNNWEQGTLTALRRESAQRVRPGCPHFGLHAGACGGCKMQHLHVGAQVAVKQRALEDNLWHLGKVRPERMLRPIEGPAWGYRYRARLSVRHVRQEGHGAGRLPRAQVAATSPTCAICQVLPPHVSALLLPLRELVGVDGRSATACRRSSWPCGDDVTALVLRHLEPLGDGRPAARCAPSAAQHGVQWWLQPKGPDTVHLLDAGGAAARPTRCPSSASRCRSGRPISPRSTTHINRVLVGARAAAARRAAATSA